MIFEYICLVWVIVLLEVVKLINFIFFIFSFRFFGLDLKWLFWCRVNLIFFVIVIVVELVFWYIGRLIFKVLDFFFFVKCL